MISVLNSVPYLPETLVVLESTANGLNHFYRRWISARDGVTDPFLGETYAAIFVPWWRDPQYAMRFPSEEQRERFAGQIGTGPYGEDEPFLVEVCGCTPEQLLWRRMQIRTQHEDNIDLFKQENPATDEEADPRAAGDPGGGEGARPGAGDAAREGVRDEALGVGDDRHSDRSLVGAGGGRGRA
jgi:hypothetical protein